jgi:hypothetical protein
VEGKEAVLQGYCGSTVLKLAGDETKNKRLLLLLLG